jgi:hypothetical protein
MPHRSRLLVVLVFAGALVAFPLGVLASHQYADVPDSNPFHGDITAITNAGITSGCGGGNYCPDRNVTRAEMAAFMNRLGALAANKTPVVNADKVDGWHANGVNRVAYNYEPDILVDGNAATNGALSTTITTPGWGYLLIWGGADIYNSTSGGSDTVTCDLRVDAVNVPGTYRDVDNQYGGTGSIDNDQVNCTTSGGYLVCDAATYTVDYHVTSVGTDTDVQEATIMVEYVPFNGAGSTPSIISCGIIILPGGATHSADAVKEP